MKELNDKNNTFGQRLKALRKRSGLTQEELAEKVNSNPVTISNWENGAFIPKRDKVKLLAQALHVSEDELLNGTPTDTWVLHVEVDKDYKEDFIDMRTKMKPQSVIITSTDGGFLKLGGSYELWTDDNAFKKLIADMKKLRSTVIQNGKALGVIKDDS